MPQCSHFLKALATVCVLLRSSSDVVVASMHSKLTTFHDASSAVRNWVPSNTGTKLMQSQMDSRFISVGARRPPMLVNFSRLPLPSSPVDGSWASIRCKHVLMPHGPTSLTLKPAWSLRRATASRVCAVSSTLDFKATATLAVTSHIPSSSSCSSYQKTLMTTYVNLFAVYRCKDMNSACLSCLGCFFCSFNIRNCWAIRFFSAAHFT